MHLGNGLVRHCSRQVKEEALPGKPKWLRFGIPAGLYTIDTLRKAGLNVDKNIPTLRHGSQGEAVKELQTLLRVRYGAGLDVDGHFGKRPEQTVKAFQSAHDLTADGIVGPKTWKALGITPDSGNHDSLNVPNNSPTAGAKAASRRLGGASGMADAESSNCRGRRHHQKVRTGRRWQS